MSKPVTASPYLRTALRSLSNADLIVLPRYEIWLSANIDAPLPEWLAEKVKTMLMTGQRNRMGSFGASSSGRCERAQVYAYLGAPGRETVDAKMARILREGTFVHLRHQVCLLLAGIIDDVEYPLTWRSKRAAGSMDGIGRVPDDHPHLDWRGKTFGLEIKSTNKDNFRKLKEAGPEPYKRQYVRYFNMSGVDLFSVLVENKDSQDMYEWVFEPDLRLIREDNEEIARLNHAIDKHDLPMRQPACRKLTGSEFRSCVFGGLTGVCARLTDFDSVVAEVRSR